MVHSKLTKMTEKQYIPRKKKKHGNRRSRKKNQRRCKGVKLLNYWSEVAIARGASGLPKYSFDRRIININSTRINKSLANRK